MNYDFDGFLSTIKYLDKEDILTAAYKKHKSLDKPSTMYSTKARLDFQSCISGLLFLLENNQKPETITDIEFAKLKPVCESLIRKEQMDADVIKLFE